MSERTINRARLIQRGWKAQEIEQRLGPGQTILWKDRELRVWKEADALAAEAADDGLAARVAASQQARLDAARASAADLSRPREHGLYRPRSIDERQRIAQDCLRGSNSHREIYAKQIIAGSLFDHQGRPLSYWHCLATHPPDHQPTPRGQWKAGTGNDGWIWQGWK